MRKGLYFLNIQVLYKLKESELKCDECTKLLFGFYKSDGKHEMWEMCSVAESKGVHISDYDKKIFGKGCKHFSKINYKEIENKRKNRIKKIKEEKKKMAKGEQNDY
jgi:hypothetical protein